MCEKNNSLLLCVINSFICESVVCVCVRERERGSAPQGDMFLVEMAVEQMKVIFLFFLFIIIESIYLCVVGRHLAC
jgi:hypothetical protein